MPAEILERLLLVVVVLVLAIVLRFFLKLVIRRVTRTLAAKGPDKSADDLGAKAQMLLARASGLALERHKQRVSTLGSLLTNVVDVVITVVTVLTVLAIVGVPMTPLLASALLRPGSVKARACVVASSSKAPKAPAPVRVNSRRCMKNPLLKNSAPV